MSLALGLRESSRRLVLTVRLGADLYSIPFEAVEEILPALPIAPMPQCADFILGVVFVLGQLVPVIDAAARLGIKDHAPLLEPHIVCLRLGDRLIGLQVDEALELVDFRSAEKRTMEDIGTQSGFLCGVADLNGEVIRMLDPERLLPDVEAMANGGIPRAV